MLMTPIRIIKPAGAVAAVALLGLAAISLTSPRVHADSENSDSRVQIGFNIAPVKLNMKGRNHDRVGVGSYIVNAQGDCNGCHQSPDIGPEYLPGSNPFFSQHPPVVNPASYLGGGRTFATFPIGAVIQSRNLTPDKTGRAEGGASLEEFITIMRTGKDFDHIHPPCPDTNHIGTDGCIQPFVGDGNLLQIMPWPAFSQMSDKDLEAIYEYLSAIPCIAHTPGAISVPASGGSPAIPVLANVYNTCN
jgi:hypothetical protein